MWSEESTVPSHSTGMEEDPSGDADPNFAEGCPLKGPMGLWGYVHGLPPCMLSVFLDIYPLPE